MSVCWDGKQSSDLLDPYMGLREVNYGLHTAQLALHPLSHFPSTQSLLLSGERPPPHRSLQLSRMSRAGRWAISLMTHFYQLLNILPKFCVIVNFQFPVPLATAESATRLS